MSHKMSIFKRRQAAINVYEPKLLLCRKLKIAAFHQNLSTCQLQSIYSLGKKVITKDCSKDSFKVTIKFVHLLHLSSQLRTASAQRLGRKHMFILLHYNFYF